MDRKHQRIVAMCVAFVGVVSFALVACANPAQGAQDSGDEAEQGQAPNQAVKLVFIHHSCGRNWLNTSNGGLGNELGANNYYVRDIYYGWDAPYNQNIGDQTDTDHWPTWFTDTTIQGNGIARRDNIMEAVYDTDTQYSTYDPIEDPGGDIEIIMFKSCYPLSEKGDSIADEQAIYNDILNNYFAQRTDKLFVLITPPGEEDVGSHELTAELMNWLVDEESGWLAGYPPNNVGVFDFYCVLSEIDSHHRVVGDTIEHTFAPDYDGLSPYHDGGDNHPNETGNQKSTEEFVPLLNHFCNRWAR